MPYKDGRIYMADPLKDGNYLKITTGEYFTRNGNKIDGIGLEPDVDVKATGEKLKQIEKAIWYSTEYLSAERYGN